MVKTRNVAKRQRTDQCTSCMESVMFSIDSLFKIASYLPADGLLNLALTCRRFGNGVGGDDGLSLTQFGIAPVSDSVGDSRLSLVEGIARRVVQDIATNEEKNALPRYDGENWLCKYNYLRSLKAPLAFDQLVGPIEYVEGNKSCVNNNVSFGSSPAFSNNIMMAGKHYVSFQVRDCNGTSVFVGVMRPGEAMQSAKYSPLMRSFYEHFTQRKESVQYNNTVNCCMFSSFDGRCLSSAWGEDDFVKEDWDGIEDISGCHKIGMLLDLDEGTLSVYKNGRKLGVMKRGLAGHYCWVVSLAKGTQVTIKRETVPAS